MKTKINIFIMMLLISGCGGGGSGSSSSNTSNNNSNNNVSEPILTQKLVGTPFEGETVGDDFQNCFFIQNEYSTLTVEEDDLPLPVFLAFFTESEETIITDAIDQVNLSIGQGEEIFEIVNEWRDNARVIMKVSQFFDSEGNERNITGYAGTFGYAEDPSSVYKDLYIVDWQIQILDTIKGNNLKFHVIHEMGHAMGILDHVLINYDEDTISDLEEDSVMELGVGTELNDYNFMMEIQGEILFRNLAQTYQFRTGSCRPD